MKALFRVILLILLINNSFVIVAQTDTIRIMTYNIAAGADADPTTAYRSPWVVNKDMLTNVSTIINNSKAEYVGLQEVDSNTMRNNKIDMANLIAERTGMIYHKNAGFPYDGGQFGNATIAKQTPIASEKVFHPRLDPNAEPRTIDITEFENFVIFNTHCDGSNIPIKVATADIINQTAERYNKPIFLIGDFNDACYNAGTPGIICNLAENWVMFNDPNKYTASNIGYPGQKNITIDYIFGYTKKGIEYEIISADVIQTTGASDHYPVVVNVIAKNCPDIFIRNSETWNSQRYGCGNIIIEGTLTIAPLCELYMQSTLITVKSGATLTVDEGKIIDTNILIEDGGKLIIKNNGSIALCKKGELTINQGGIFDLIEGIIFQK